MRISDWSSDVCSSDLRWETTAPHPKADAVAIMAKTTEPVAAWRRQTRPHLTARGRRGQSRVHDGHPRQRSVARYRLALFRSRDGRRSEERRVGKEGGSTGRSRWVPTP